MNQEQLDFNRKITDEAIAAAVNHADAIHEQWSEKAYDFLKGYAEINPKFMAEDVRMTSYGVVPEANGRAWGGVIRRAVIAGIIYNNNNETAPVKNSKAHMANAKVWRSTIYKPHRL